MSKRSLWVSLILTVLASLGAVTIAHVTDTTPTLGLDLQGGFSVVLQAREVNGELPSEESVEKAKDIIRQRVDGLGVAEPEIIRQGRTVIVQLPGVTDRAKAESVVGCTAKLEFRPVLAVQANPDAPQATTTTTKSDKKSTTTTTKSDKKSTTTTKAGSTTTTKAGDGEGETGSGTAGLSAGEGALPGQFAPTTTTTTAPPTTTTAPPATTTTAPASTTTTTAADGATTGSTPGRPPTAATPAASHRHVDRSHRRPATPLPPGGVIVPSKDGALMYTLGPVGLHRRRPEQGRGRAAGDLDGQRVGQGVEEDRGQRGVQRLLQRRGHLPAPVRRRQGRDRHRARRPGALRPRRERRRPGQRQLHDQRQLRPGRGQGTGPGAALRLAAGRVRPGGPPAGLGHARHRLAPRRPARRFRGHRPRRPLHAPVLPGPRPGGHLRPHGLGWPHVRPGLLAVGQPGLGAHAVGHHRHRGVGGHHRGLLRRVLRADERRGQIGSKRRSATDRGFNSAIRTIITADVASFLGAFLLWWLTVGPVRGFAFFLGISVVLDLFVAYFFTRPVVALLSYNKRITDSKFMGLGSSRERAVDQSGASA